MCSCVLLHTANGRCCNWQLAVDSSGMCTTACTDLQLALTQKWPWGCDHPKPTSLAGAGSSMHHECYVLSLAAPVLPPEWRRRGADSVAQASHLHGHFSPHSTLQQVACVTCPVSGKQGRLSVLVRRTRAMYMIYGGQQRGGKRLRSMQQIVEQISCQIVKRAKPPPPSCPGRTEGPQPQPLPSALSGAANTPWPLRSP